MYYSQHGEDRWIAENLLHGQDARATGLMVEVGVGRWKEYSNSLHFEERGWRTILVEPNPQLHPEIRARRSGTLLECAAGAYDGIVDFQLEAEPTLSGIKRSPLNCRRIQVPIRTLTAILDDTVGDLRAEYAAQFITPPPLPIDVLSIDTEGTELEVWRGLDLTRYAPQIVIIEFATMGLPEDPMSIIRRLVADGYALVHLLGGNLIFAASRSMGILPMSE